MNTIVTAFQNFQPKLYELFDEGFSVYNTDFEDDFIRDNLTILSEYGIPSSAIKKFED